MDEGLAFGLFVGAISLVVVLISGSRRHTARIALWEQVAAERGGVVDAKRYAPFTSTSGSLEVEVGEAAVVVDAYTRRQHSSSKRLVRVRACLLVPAGPRFRVRRKSVLSLVLEPAETRETTMSDPDFDGELTISTDDPERTSLIWCREARALMLEHFLDGRVECEGRVVKLEYGDAGDARARLDAGIDLVGMLASADLFGLEALERLPGARYFPPEGPWNDRTIPYVEVDDGVLATVGPVLTAGGRPVTQVDTEEVVWDEELRLEVAEGGQTEPADVSLPEDALARLREVGSGTLKVTRDRAVFRWAAIEIDRRRLAAGVRLVAGFGVARARGAYR
jgi:hypothetical protein